MINNIPPKRDRFSTVMKGFAYASLFMRLLYAFLFYWMGRGNLFVFSFVCALVWLVLAILNHNHHSQLAFGVGVFEISIFALVATVLMGWESGFYLVLIEAIPLNFYNVKMKKSARVLLGCVLSAVLLILFGYAKFTPLPGVLDSSMTTLIYAVNLVAICFIFALMGYLFELSSSDAEKEIVIANQKLLTVANTDPVTNLINRRIMMNKIEAERAKVDLGGKPFSLIMIDIDNFKQINDEYGHEGGDFVLVNLSKMISISVRKTDIVSRWGGDEFLILLPETLVQYGELVAEKVRLRITHAPFVYREMDIAVTVTLGVAQCDGTTNIGGCLRRADQALYQGKQIGKNRVVTYE